MRAQGHTDSEHDDERAPLLERVHPTPLPKGQMFAMLLLMMAEPTISLSIMPYINEVGSA
jgi:hypothetical protein